MGWARGLQRTTRRTLKNARTFCLATIQSKQTARASLVCFLTPFLFFFPAIFKLSFKFQEGALYFFPSLFIFFFKKRKCVRREVKGRTDFSGKWDCAPVKNL